MQASRGTRPKAPTTWLGRTEDEERSAALSGGAAENCLWRWDLKFSATFRTLEDYRDNLAGRIAAPPFFLLTPLENLTLL